MSWATKIIQKSNDTVYLECVFPDNSCAYYVLKANRAKLPELLKNIEQKTAYNLDDYGTVLEKGWGPLPEKYKS